MVRPERFELPTFWFVGMQSGAILLIQIMAVSVFWAKAWRTEAHVDERLMKGSLRPFEH